MKKTSAQVVAECNRLAGLLYEQQGYKVHRNATFHDARHPQELALWRTAAMAYEFITGIDPDDELEKLEASHKAKS